MEDSDALSEGFRESSLQELTLEQLLRNELLTRFPKWVGQLPSPQDLCVARSPTPQTQRFYNIYSMNPYRHKNDFFTLIFKGILGVPECFSWLSVGLLVSARVMTSGS